MRVFLTFDYELFFGTKTGSIQKCLLEPTSQLLEMSRKHNVPMTFFVDIGYLIQLQQWSTQYPVLLNDLAEIEEQLAVMTSSNCSLALHIHPHWEKAIYDGQKWVIDASDCYKLSDFDDHEVEEIVRKYHVALQAYSTEPITSFRAGGWCIQPFLPLVSVFKELGIHYDSTVFPQGQFDSEHYAFDFTGVEPFSSSYRFETDVCAAEEEGTFTEVPISSWHYNPFFFWRLYGWGRLQPSQHKMIGDGNFIPQPGRKKSSLLNFTWNHVSSDGYFASMIDRQAKYYAKKGVSDFVVIGHPKSATHFSMKKLEQFIANNKDKFDFKRFNV